MHDPTDIRARTRAYYDAVGQAYYDLFKDELDHKPYDRALLDRFVRELGPGARLCDAGCGPCAHTTDHLARAGLDVLGIDLSSVCVRLARAAHPTLRFLTMAMEALAFRDASFDGVLAYYSLLYTPKAHLPRLLRELGRVLKPGGRLLVAVKEGEGEGWIADPMGTAWQTFFANFVEAELLGLLQGAGFRPVFSETRAPYDFEIAVRRIYAIAEKPAA